MGIYYSAQALIGYKINLDKFHSNIQVPSCEHNTAGAQFCPHCGQKVQMFNQRTVGDEYINFKEGILECITDKTIIWDFDYNGDNLYIGYGVNCGSDESNFIKLPDNVDEIKIKIHEILAEMNKFLTYKEFGLWVTNIGH